MSNVDQAELEKFSQVAHKWWDTSSEFKPLHDINPLRLDYISQQAGGLAGKRVLDVGCGGGILSEGLARVGAVGDAEELGLRHREFGHHAAQLLAAHRRVGRKELETHRHRGADLIHVVLP